MAISEIHAAPQQSRFWPAVRSMFATIGKGLQAARNAEARIEQIRRLQALTDDQLAAHGIARDDIVRHTLRDLFTD